MPGGPLQGKVAVVTGAASGIGRASATRLASHGATVVAVDLELDEARHVARPLGGVAVGADVGRPSDWDAVTDACHALGGVDAVHLNAGVVTGQDSIEELDDAHYRRIMGANVDGVVFGIRSLLPLLRARGGGAVVATASLAGVIAFPADPVYAMTKHAVVGLVRALAPRVAELGVTVNAVCPGLVDTPLLGAEARRALSDAGFPLIAPEAVAEAVAHCVLGTETGDAWVVQAGREPIAYRFGRPPGPRAAGAEGRAPPGWLADPASR